MIFGITLSCFFCRIGISKPQHPTWGHLQGANGRLVADLRPGWGHWGQEHCIPNAPWRWTWWTWWTCKNPMFTNLLNGLFWSGFFDRYHGYHNYFAGRGVRTFVDQWAAWCPKELWLSSFLGTDQQALSWGDGEKWVRAADLQAGETNGHFCR